MHKVSGQLSGIFRILFLGLFCTACGTHRKPEIVHIENPSRGEMLFKSVGCTTCHSVTGESRYGPPLNSIFGKEVVVIRNGDQTVVTVDRQYLIRSLRDPEMEKVLNYEKKKMPPIDLTQEEIECLVDYIISVNKAH